MKKLLAKGFTLIELLIVIGILGILVVAVLLTLNPAESQRKARDTQRMKELGTMQAIVSQALDDGITFNCAAAVCVSGASSSTAAGNWMDSENPIGTNVSLSAYASKLPIDPLNVNPTATCNNNGTQIAGCSMHYYLKVNGVNYTIGVRQEAAGNTKNVNGDGGTNNCLAEVVGTGVSFSAQGAGACTNPT